MNKLYFFIIAIFTLINCDGRDRATKSNQEILKETKLLDSFSEKIEFIPETYSEIRKDTILNKGFNIKIISYTDMSNSVVTYNKNGSLLHKEHYRDWISEVIVLKDNRVIFKDKIDSSFYKKNNISLAKFKNKAVRPPVILDEEKSLDNNSISLVLGHVYVRDGEISSYTLNINSEGDYNIKQLNNSETI